jgi:hypothetical protein
MFAIYVYLVGMSLEDVSAKDSVRTDIFTGQKFSSRSASPLCFLEFVFIFFSISVEVVNDGLFDTDE